jgi:hypothetical protein
MISNETIEGIAMRTAQAHSDSYGSLKEKWNSLYERYENKPRIGSISMKTESKVSLGAAFFSRGKCHSEASRTGPEVQVHGEGRG